MQKIISIIFLGGFFGVLLASMGSRHALAEQEARHSAETRALKQTIDELRADLARPFEPVKMTGGAW